MAEARITVMRAGGKIPARATIGSVGYDLSAATDIVIPPLEHALVPTGIIVTPPQGSFVLIAARSSLIKRGLVLANGVGIVDEDYIGPTDEIKLSLFNLRQGPVAITSGDRLCQMIFMQRPLYPTIIDLPMEERTRASRGGFGSTDNFDY